MLDEGDLSASIEVIDSNIAPELSRTIDGDIVGTPLYMAPEQALGDHEGIDKRTDVYGLGAILFSILTGSAPHHKTARSADGTVKIKNSWRRLPNPIPPEPEITVAKSHEN